MTDNKARLKKLYKKSHARFSLLSAAVVLLVTWVWLVDWYYYINFNMLFARRAFYKRTVQRAHWVGSEIARPHRLAFTALACVLLTGVVTAPNTQSALHWSIGWGGFLSVYIMYRSLTLIFSHNPPHIHRNWRAQN